ncbi:arpin-like [Acanthaster planci]|uniref:Arpin n=1 Tax=Acanthaster planci TaxID=133434 RepID=A0A8B7YQE9_ACAPL|nr:arpin-like [Acanthaster planci]
MSRLYDNQPLQSVPVENHLWKGQWYPEVHSGPGVLLDGVLNARSKHIITDSNQKKSRYVVLHITPTVAHRRKFDSKGVEIEPNFSDTQKVNKGHLMSSYKTEAKGKTDRLSTPELISAVSRQDLSSLTSKYNKEGCVALWATEEQLDKMELENGDTLRLKTTGDCPFIFSLAKLDTVTSRVSNYAGGETVGSSWTDKVMSMKSQDSPEPQDGGGAEDDEWDD